MRRARSANRCLNEDLMRNCAHRSAQLRIASAFLKSARPELPRRTRRTAFDAPLDSAPPAAQPKATLPCCLVSLSTTFRYGAGEQVIRRYVLHAGCGMIDRALRGQPRRVPGSGSTLTRSFLRSELLFGAADGNHGGLRDRPRGTQVNRARTFPSVRASWPIRRSPSCRLQAASRAGRLSWLCWLSDTPTRTSRTAVRELSGAGIGLS